MANFSIDDEISEYVRDIFREKTDRDRQKTVGASNISNPCSKCLAEAIATGMSHQSEYNMGAKIGTAIHEYLETHNKDQRALKEHNGLIDVIEGYGDITSTTDLYLIDRKTVLDFKTSTRAKMEVYRRDWELGESNTTLEQYFRQAMLYAYMIEDDVKTVAICFIARDGQKIDRDIFAISMPYRESIAVNAMNRVKKIYAWLQEPGNDWEDIASHEDCFVCNYVRM